MTAKFAVVANGAVTNVVVADPGYASTQGWVAVGASVGIGWVTSDGGTTWTPPPTPPPSALQQAQNQLGQLVAGLAAQISQAQTDAQTMTTLTAGQPLTSAHVAVLQRYGQGWPVLLGGLHTLVQAAGLAT